VKQIRGVRGTTVDLTLVRSGSWGVQFIEKTVTRDTITIPSVSSKILTWKQLQHIGYISLSIFWSETNTLLQQEIQTLHKAWISWLILDLRGNGWWLLPEAVTIASHFLPMGMPVVQAKYRIYTSQTYFSEWTNDLDLPLVILVDGGTASASEIVALALRESTCWWWSWWELRDCIDPFPCPTLQKWYDACIASSRVLIIWQQTFGKWSIQVLQPVTFGGSLKLTVGKRFSPSGKTIDKVWITPDIVVDMDPERYLKDGIDPQLQKGLDILSQKRL
jgi:carboxyl-terminal processing protease